jgi:hypothetical protein
MHQLEKALPFTDLKFISPSLASCGDKSVTPGTGGSYSVTMSLSTSTNFLNQSSQK